MQNQPVQKAAAAGAPPEEREEDDAEGDAAAASASYDYLLSMPIHSLTHEKARRQDCTPLVAPCPPVHMVFLRHTRDRLTCDGRTRAGRHSGNKTLLCSMKRVAAARQHAEAAV